MQYQAPENFLKDKIILVTGAGDGIGKTAAISYAQYGATVVLLGRTVHKLEKVYDEIKQNGYPEPAIYPMNLEGATPKDYQDLANTLKDNFGRLDGLLHNAAFLGANTPLEHYDTELWYKVMQVNLNAPFIMTQALLPLMKETPDASIIFTVDDKTNAYWGAYGISKAGLINFMSILADELDSEKRVKVNAINPGPVRTAMRMKAYPGEDPNTLLNPEDIMPAYLYLMSNDTQETGQVINAQD